MEGINIIDISADIPGYKRLLELADPLPTMPSTNSDDKMTTEIISGFWMHIRLLAPPDGHIVTSLEEAFQYFWDFRKNPGGSVSSIEVIMKNEFKEYIPFPSDVHVYLDTGEPRTAVKLWQGYE